MVVYAGDITDQADALSVRIADDERVVGTVDWRHVPRWLDVPAEQYPFALRYVVLASDHEDATHSADRVMELAIFDLLVAEPARLSMPVLTDVNSVQRVPGPLTDTPTVARATPLRKHGR